LSNESVISNRNLHVIREKLTIILGVAILKTDEHTYKKISQNVSDIAVLLPLCAMVASEVLSVIS
jgi:hypothetical protein